MAAAGDRIRIPLSNPAAGYRMREEEVLAAVRRILASGTFILGRECESFEREFADVVGAKEAVGVANGTDAITLTLKALGVGAGSEVLTASHTAVATVAAIELAGATPVFADIDPKTLTIATEGVEAAIGPRTRAVVAVHLYGRIAEIEGLLRICSKYDIHLVEDCAQALGARYGGRPVGTFGIAGTFSFYPTKNLGAMGDGGAVVTNDPDLAARLRRLRQYGWRDRFVSQEVGMNSRLDELQAAFLRVRLASLNQDIDARRRIADEYQRRLRGLPGLTLCEPPGGCSWAHHLYVVRVKGRDAVADALLRRGIGTGVHYPVPVHLQPAYRDRLKPRIPLTQTEVACAEILSLPIFPELPDGDVSEVCAALESLAERT